MSKTFILAICVLFIVSINSATFSINSVSTCTSTSPTGFCTRWEQNGSVVETTSCFPAEAEVYVLKDGIPVLTNMGQLQIGDKIQGFDGFNAVYTEVVGWLHKNVSAVGEYLNIQTTNTNFIVSSSHNIALEDGSYAFANELLHKRLHGGYIVQKIQKITASGIYAPMTKQGNFYVQIGSSQKILAHCFANIRNPEFYRPFFNIIWWAWQTMFGVDKNKQIHPAAEWMMKTFSFLIEY